MGSRSDDSTVTAEAHQGANLAARVRVFFKLGGEHVIGCEAGGKLLFQEGSVYDVACRELWLLPVKRGTTEDDGGPLNKAVEVGLVPLVAGGGHLEHEGPVQQALVGGVLGSCLPR